MNLSEILAMSNPTFAQPEVIQSDPGLPPTASTEGWSGQFTDFDDEMGSADAYYGGWGGNLADAGGALLGGPRKRWRPSGRHSGRQEWDKRTKMMGQFVPGFSHGHKYSIKRRKVKKKYKDPMEEKVHDVVVKGHADERRKIMESNEFKGQKEKIEDFLANVQHGRRRKTGRARKVHFSPKKDEPEPEKESTWDSD